MKTALLLSFLFLASAAPASAAPAPAAAPATPPAAMFTLRRLTANVWAAIALPHSPAGSNAGFVIGDRAILVIDTFEDARAAEQLRDAIRQFSGLPIRYVVDTHYHLDHVGGNGVFAAAGATILAQAHVRDWERSENLKFFGPNITPAERARVEALTLPNLTYDTGVNLDLGGVAVEVRDEPGHTGGDSVVSIPSAEVVFTGDLLWNHTLPNLVDASTGPWLGTLGGLLGEHPNATFVPGHGDVARADDVRAFRGYLRDLRTDVRQAQQQGKTGDALVQQVTAALKPRYGWWAWFDAFAARNIADTDAELRGTKHLPG